MSYGLDKDVNYGTNETEAEANQPEKSEPAETHESENGSKAHSVKKTETSKQKSKHEASVPGAAVAESVEAKVKATDAILTHYGAHEDDNED